MASIVFDPLPHFHHPLYYLKTGCFLSVLKASPVFCPPLFLPISWLGQRISGLPSQRLRVERMENLFFRLAYPLTCKHFFQKKILLGFPITNLLTHRMQPIPKLRTSCIRLLVLDYLFNCYREMVPPLPPHMHAFFSTDLREILVCVLPKRPQANSYSYQTRRFTHLVCKSVLNTNSNW